MPLPSVPFRSPVPPPSSRREYLVSWMRPLRWPVRLLLTGATLYLAWSSVVASIDLFGPHDDEAASETAESIEAVGLPDGEFLFAEGSWRFPDFEWEVAVRTLAGGRFSELAPPVRSGPPADGERGDLEMMLFDWARRSGASTRAAGDGTFDFGGPSSPQQVRLYTRTDADGTERVDSVRFGIRTPDGWNCLEAVRTGGRSAPSPSVRIIELPPDAKCLLTRLSPSGDVQSEFVKTESSTDDLIRLWNEAAWIVRPLPPVPGSSIREVVCRRQDREIRAVCWERPGTPGTAAMFVDARSTNRPKP